MAVPDRESIRNHAAFIWSVADLLRGDYKQSEYGRVILPFVVLRRLDCVLEPTKEAVVQRASALAGRVANVDPLLRQVTGEQFYNTSPLTMHRVLDDPNNVADNLLAYTRAFSSGARDVLEKFDLPVQVARLDAAGLLYLVTSSGHVEVLRDRPASRRGVQPGDAVRRWRVRCPCRCIPSTAPTCAGCTSRAPEENERVLASRLSATLFGSSSTRRIVSGDVL